ncbi:uncharacterized protein [Palaemon carinicauda]|uniref:uncharacterized protein n=1 Tax=Palaemon carinicauda TaxID=392227 RepID=UPI0035B58BDE
MKCGTEVDGERWPETTTPQKNGKRCRQRRRSLDLDVNLTPSFKPWHPINFKQNRSLTDIVITWNDHPDDKNYKLYYDLIFQNETYNISEKEYKFTGLQAEHTYPLQIKSCNQWMCSEVLKKFISTDSWSPEIEGSIEVLDYVFKMQLPRVKNPPAVQYVVVVEALENLNDARIKQLALEVVEKYIEEEENNSKHRMSKRSTTEREPEIWIAGKYPIENATTKTVDVGTGEGENRSFQPEKSYNLVVVTEKKSGGNREFTVSDPVSTKGKAVASGRTGILVGVFIIVALIGLLTWTYKKRQTRSSRGQPIKMETAFHLLQKVLFGGNLLYSEGQLSILVLNHKSFLAWETRKFITP